MGKKFVMYVGIRERIEEGIFVDRTPNDGSTDIGSRNTLKYSEESALAWAALLRKIETESQAAARAVLAMEDRGMTPDDIERNLPQELND